MPEIENGNNEIEERENSINEIVEEINGAKPEEEKTPLINPESIKADLPEVTSPTTQESVKNDLVDSEGNSFDERIHMTRNGEPVLTRKGKLRRKPGKNPASYTQEKKPEQPKSENPDNLINPDENIQAESEEPQAINALPCNVNGAVAARMLESAMIMIFGKEWEYQKIKDYDENENMANVLQRWMDEKGLTELPPSLELICVMSIYAAPRLKAESTKSRLSTWWNKLKSYWYGFRGRKTRTANSTEGATVA